jgi:hypothetical protein
MIVFIGVDGFEWHCLLLLDDHDTNTLRSAGAFANKLSSIQKVR